MITFSHAFFAFFLDNSAFILAFCYISLFKLVQASYFLSFENTLNLIAAGFLDKSMAFLNKQIRSLDGHGSYLRKLLLRDYSMIHRNKIVTELSDLMSFYSCKLVEDNVFVLARVRLD